MLNCYNCQGELKKVENAPANTVDSETNWSSQSYAVYQCVECSNVEGCRHQYDVGTGHDDRWNSFGKVDPMTVKRHY